MLPYHVIVKIYLPIFRSNSIMGVGNVAMPGRITISREHAEVIASYRRERERAQAAFERQSEHDLENARTQSLLSKPDKNCYPVRNDQPAIVVRRKRRRSVIPDQAAPSDRELVNRVGTLPASGDTLDAGVDQGLQGADDTLRNLSPMQASTSQSIHPTTKAVTVTEVIEGTEADVYERLKLIEREAWKVYQGELRGARRPTVMMGLLEGLANIQTKQVGAAKAAKVERSAPIEWESLKDRILAALAEHPEALASVMRALVAEE